MTASELKYQVEQHATESYFFTRKTMKFFGDTMRNYGVCKATIDTYTQKDIEVWELYRKRPVKHNNQASAYFNRETFQRVLARKAAHNDRL